MPPTVCVLSGYLAGSYEGPVISAVLRVVSQAGGRVMAIQTAGSGADYHQGITLKDLAPVGWRKVSGFITVANAVPLAYLESMTEAGKPVVAISNEVPGFNCPAVLPDNVGGVKQAVEHLLEHGHKRIAFVGCLDQFDIRERYEAYRSALREHGVRPDPRLLYHAENNFEHGALSAARAMVAAGLPSTAVVAATDLNAVAVLRSLKEAGYRLPREQAIVGFDDKPDCGLVSPSLSTVSQDLDCLGTLAAELLLEQLAGETVAPGRYVVPTSFVARESCGCAGERKRARRAGPDHEEPVDTYVRAVGEVSGPGTSDSETTVACLSSELSDIYHEVAAAEPTARQLLRLSQICEDLYGHNPCQATYDAILLLASELSERLEGVAASYGPGVAERLAQCTSQVRLSLTKALLDVRNDAYYELRKAIRDEYQITLDLLADHSQDPRLLAWLHSTEARRGVLALWRDNGAPRAGGRGRAGSAEEALLDVVGTFEASGGELALSSDTMSVESFPPEELFGPGAVGLVCLFPVKSPETDWGFLAVAQPTGARLEQEAYFMWSALFSEALDHRALLASLSQRSEDLARSYRREREMAQAVRESEERYALAAQAANDGLWDWDLAKGTIYYSSRWKEMLGFDEGAIGEAPEEWLGRVHPEDKAGLLSELAALKRGERGSVLNEHRVQARDSRYLWVLCRGLAVPGLGAAATRVVGSLTDVTERRSLEERLRQQALYDSLTGLPNRVLFLDRLSHAMASAKRRRGASYAVLWLDLDNFKTLNDTLGHLYGDKLLVQVAERIRSHVRETDTAARFGGDEFVLLLQDAEDEAVVSAVVGRLSERLNEPYDLDGHKVVVTASVGVAVSGTGYERPEEILRDADIAMYEAKAKGSGACVTFDSTMRGLAPGGKGHRRAARPTSPEPVHTG